MDSPHRGLTARRRFWVVVFALVSLGVMAGGLAYYRYEQDHIRQEHYQNLAAIADLKVRQILDWRRERLDDGNRIARSPFLRQAIMDWLRDPGTPGLRAALLERFKSEQEGETLGNVLLADPDGRILLSVRPDPAPLSPAEKQTIEAAIAGRQAVLGDLFRCPKNHLVLLDLAAPVLDHQGRPLAVVVMRINADRVLYPLVESWPTPSRTAETLLVEVEGKDVLFLNELRHREKTALSLREPLTQTELPAVQAGLGKQGIFEGRDYRGVEVLAEIRPVPQTPWFMVAKVDRVEIMAEARYRAGITAIFVVIFILLTAAVTAYGYRQRQANLYQDLYQTEREQRQVQEEFRTTLYSIGDAVITTDTEGLVKHINPVAERLTVWLEAEARGKPIEEVFRIINEETRTAVENPAQRVLREGVVVGLANHTLLIARDGAEHPIADSGAPIRDENGAVIGVVLVFRDQTEERAAQNALRESEEHYRSLFDNMLNGFAYCKMLFEQNQAQDFIYLNVNSSFEILTGLKNVVGKRVSEVIPGLRESDPELFEIYGRVALTGKPERLETYVEALKMWFSISVYSPEKEYFVAVFDVITERKQAEEALKENVRLNQILLDALPCVALLLRPQTREIIASNAVAAKIGAVPGTRCFSTWGQRQDPCPWCLAPAVWATGEAQHLEVEVLGIFWDAYWIPVAEDLFMHFAFDITERKGTEEALRASEERYRTVADYTYDMEYWINEEGKVLYMSPSCERFTGYPAQAFIDDAKLLNHIVHPHDIELFKRHGKEAYSGAESLNLDFRLIHRNGQELWVNHTCQHVVGEDGRPLGRRASNHDITARKRAEEALAEQRELMDYVICHDPNAIAVYDNELRYVFVSERYLNDYGVKGKDIIGKHYYEVFPEMPQRWKDVHQRVLAGEIERSDDDYFERPDGSITYNRWECRPWYRAGGRIGGMITYTEVTTERKLAEMALRESEERFRLVFEKAPIGIMLYDQTSVITNCNEKFEEITGAPKKKLLSFNMIRQLRNEQIREAVAVSLRGEVGYYEGDFRSVISGKSTTIRAIYQPIFSPEGVMSGGLTLYEDISEHKKAESERLRFSKLESLSTLAGGIAHDFNNILQVMLGNISLATLDYHNKKSSLNRLNEIEGACMKAKMLAQQLLTFAKGGTPIKELISVKNLVTEAVSFACSGSKAQFTFSLPKNLLTIEADPGQITQALHNLVFNALQAMPTGGTIKVQGENLVVQAKSDLPLGAGKYVKISIQDQGVGIPAEHLARIFDPYFTTKQTGSGLGLATTYSIVDSHHGHISVESTLGEETTFHIYLPAVGQKIAEPPREAIEVLVGQGKILVMDDADMVRHILGTMLGRLGYEAKLAKDGAEAIELFTQAQESGKAFDALILDLTVPGGMGGKETIEKLLKIDPGVKAIVSSGYSEDTIMAEFAKYGFSGVIPKPYRISELSKLLHKVLSKGK